MSEVQTPDINVINEMMVPELSEDTFTICEQVVQIKPLTVRNEMLLKKKVGAAVREVAQASDESDWAMMEKMDQHAETVIEIIAMLCSNDGKDITKDQILDQRELSTNQLAEIVHKYCLKLGVMQDALSFFTEKLMPKAQELRVVRQQAAISVLQMEIDFQNNLISMNSATSSVSDTPDGPSDTSLD